MRQVLAPAQLCIYMHFLDGVLGISIHKVAMNHLTFYGNFHSTSGHHYVMVIERHKTLLLFHRGKKEINLSCT